MTDKLTERARKKLGSESPTDTSSDLAAQLNKIMTDSMNGAASPDPVPFRPTRLWEAADVIETRPGREVMHFGRVATPDLEVAPEDQIVSISDDQVIDVPHAAEIESSAPAYDMSDMDVVFVDADIAEDAQEDVPADIMPVAVEEDSEEEFEEVEVDMDTPEDMIAIPVPYFVPSIVDEEIPAKVLQAQALAASRTKRGQAAKRWGRGAFGVAGVFAAMTLMVSPQNSDINLQPTVRATAPGAATAIDAANEVASVSTAADRCLDEKRAMLGSSTFDPTKSNGSTVGNIFAYAGADFRGDADECVARTGSALNAYKDYYPNGATWQILGGGRYGIVEDTVVASGADKPVNTEGLTNRKVRTVTVRPDGTIISRPAPDAPSNALTYTSVPQYSFGN